MSDKRNKQKLTYADAGVDIAAGDAAVEKIKTLAKATFNRHVLTGIGAFGGFYKPDFEGINDPVLISSSDGVGTKLKLAFMADRHDTIGQDIVNHCIDDILVHGARPLYFMDYIATGKLKPDTVAAIVAGVSTACQAAGIPLLGGETAEMPDMYSPGEYDLAGFVVGVVDQNKIINGATIKEGDVCLGLPSNGLHTNGYTLARKVVFEIAGLKVDDQVPELGGSVWEALMAVHRCYSPIVRPLLDRFNIHGMAHITGGGIEGNLNRIMPEGLGARIDKSSWPVPPVFEFMRDRGDLDPVDIYRTFNMGIGYILVADPAKVAGIVRAVEEMSEEIYRIGVVAAQTKPVELIG